MTTRVGFLPLFQIKGPSSRYRVFQFLDPLRELGFQCTVLEAPQRAFVRRIKYVPQLLRIARDHDVLYVQKRILPMRLIDLISRFNALLIFDIDDAIYLLPKLQAKVNRMLAAAAIVVAGNETLAQYARAYNDNVRVIPTVVDTRLYFPPDGQRHLDDDRIIIGWIGSDPNRGDLQPLRPVFDWLAERYGEQVVLQTIGRRPLQMETGLTVEFIRWTLDGSRQALQRFDIGIMPLEDTEWNRGKCGFKLIQYLAVGAPAVASPVGVNEQIVRDGVTGYLAGDPGEWGNRLAQLIQDAGLRKMIGRQGRAYIDRNYSLKVALPLLVEAIKETAVSRSG